LNAVEIEEAVSELAAAPFERVEFPFAFLSAFGNKETTVKRLRSASSNSSDVEGGVLQRNNIHIAVCPVGSVGETLTELRASLKTATNKAKFILATDGVTLEAEDLNSGETVACDYLDLADHFGFFLPLAGISTVRAIKNNPIDIKATGRLNKLYVELLRENPDWATDARRPEMNQFMARLIFCFFAEDTGIFQNHLFTKTIGQMTDSQSANTHDVLAELFRAMDMRSDDPERQSLPRWANEFPYVNGGLFTGSSGCPHFTRIARSYLLRAAELNWQEINPDIFGSMIQAVADDEERGELGMHYTSVPNILKVLNPLFLDGLREQLEAAGDNERRGEQYLLIKSPPASGKSRALMFIALDKLHNQNVKKAIIVVPERSIGGSFADESLSKFGFWADWTVKPQWNLCNAPGIDTPSVAKSKVKAVGQFLASEDRVMVCTHATFRFAVDELGIEAFDDCLIAVDEFHHVSANPDNRLGAQLGALSRRCVWFSCGAQEACLCHFGADVPEGATPSFR
jgi:hypothetical protein